MSDGSYFIDTNVLVYANDSADVKKQATAIRLVTGGIRSGRGVISSQVLSEFWVTVTQKIQVPLDREKAENELENFRAMRIISIDYDTVRAAVHLQKRHQLSYWDALILSTAQIAGCRCIYSEDLNQGHKYGDLVIVDPFSKGS